MLLVPYPYLGVVVASSSMEPTIHCANPVDGDCRGKRPDLVLQEQSGARSVRRGDIVAFRLPVKAVSYCAPGSGEALKRVIGVGGDRVSERDGIVSVNGRVLKEPYVPASERDHRSGNWVVPSGSFLVMGDDRRVSCDSRYWGPLRGSLLIGRVVEILRPAPGGSDPVGPPVIHSRFRFDLYQAESAAMEPTLHCAYPRDGALCQAKLEDDFLVERSGARLLKRGAIVSFLLPPSAARYCGTGTATERVIGLGGDQVSEHHGTVSVNGHRLSEPYVPANQRDHRTGTWHVPEGSLFVMADLRSKACDSRLWGPLSQSRVEGPVVAIFRPRHPSVRG